jgi:predicted PurR-regulated permease PerM
MVRITQIDSALRHLAEPGAVLPDELQQNRQKATVELVLLTGQLGNELLPDHQVQPEGDSSTGGKRRVQLEELLHEFQDQLQALVAARGDDAKFRVALAGATQTFEQLPLALYGGPVRSWLKQAVRFDASQVDSIRNEVRQLAGPLAVGTTQYVGSVLLQVIVVLAVMSVALYYFLADGPDMVDHLASLTPLENRYEQQLLDQFSALLRAILIAMLLSAFVQGLLAAAAYLWFGFDSVFLLTVLTMVLAIVPFVGAIPVWGSCALWLFLHDGRPQAAIALAIYGIVIGVVGDNVIKPMVLHGRSNLHPLLGLLSVLGGAQALGPIGIIVGPMAVALLQTLLIMLRAELAVLDIRGQETRPIDTPLPS